MKGKQKDLKIERNRQRDREKGKEDNHKGTAFD